MTLLMVIVGDLDFCHRRVDYTNLAVRIAPPHNNAALHLGDHQARNQRSRMLAGIVQNDYPTTAIGYGSVTWSIDYLENSIIVWVH
ncbi:hypothetical protein TNCV_4306581 [Trichonephila clavipes]|nr:hypothetical protein TNCV_4306581 [Trichonephila clavipes]